MLRAGGWGATLTELEQAGGRFGGRGLVATLLFALAAFVAGFEGIVGSSNPSSGTIETARKKQTRRDRMDGCSVVKPVFCHMLSIL